MPQIGPLELLVLGAIALIVFGPTKLPEVARTIGRTLNQFRRMADEVRAEFQADLDVPEDDRVRPPDERPEPERLTPTAGTETDEATAAEPTEADAGDETAETGVSAAEGDAAETEVSAADNGEPTPAPAPEPDADRTRDA